MELALPSLATGPVDRVWYSPDGATLFAKAASGRVFETGDFEQWKLVTDAKANPPSENNPSAANTPEAGLKLTSAAASGRLYGVGHDVYRSDDSGQSWTNLTAYRGACILGAGLASVAASPSDPDEVSVASGTGVWRSVDGGLSWTGLNDFLPNLPSGRLLALPSGTRGVRLSLANDAGEIEWAPGEKTAWKAADATEVQREQALKSALSQVLKSTVSAIATAEDYIYAGDWEGRLRVSADAGVSWGAVSKLGDAGKIEAIWVDPSDPRVAVAALSARTAALPDAARPVYVLRTMNGGGFLGRHHRQSSGWGVAARRDGRSRQRCYLCRYRCGGILHLDRSWLGGPSHRLDVAQRKLPAAAATDVKLDAGANQIYAALDGYGVYTAIAPHRLRSARVVSAADYSDRPAAPGGVLSVIGAHVESAASGDVVAPVLHASDTASDIQVPFSASGNTLSLSLTASAGPLAFQIPLKTVSPAIFVDPEGTPLIMDSASGILLDSTKPARAGSASRFWPPGSAR